jgi:hypothetical protein
MDTNGFATLKRVKRRGGHGVEGLKRYSAGLTLGLERSPKKQGTRELPREFPITFNFFNLLTHSPTESAEDAG